MRTRRSWMYVGTALLATGIAGAVASCEGDEFATTEREGSPPEDGTRSDGEPREDARNDGPGPSGFGPMGEPMRTTQEPGFEKVVGNLTYPTAIAWDDENRMYVLEAGGQFLEEPPPARILRVENGQATPVIDLEGKVEAPVVGLLWHKGAFYFTHRNPQDRTGAVSKATLDGTVTMLISGIIDSQAEHNLNDIVAGPDGRIYFGAGPATNSGVVGIDLAPFVSRSPGLHPTACEDIVLTGRNFKTPDFRTKDPSDLAETGAYVPFGTATRPGQVIPGTNKCGGSVLAFDPADPEGTLAPYAWGLRNVVGLGWDNKGQLYAAINGFDIRGSRPVDDEFDPLYRIVEGTWYGFPDFSAALEPVTTRKFDVPDHLQAPVFVNGEPEGRGLGFVIDHEASGLEPPDPSLVAALHPINSSPSKFGLSPASWGDLAGRLFVAEWGDLAPATTPLLDEHTGHRIVMVDPESGRFTSYLANKRPGPASEQGATGEGLERPLDVKFGPDGAMYIVDYGIARVNPARAAEGQVPYEFPPGTGVVWRLQPE